MGVNMEEIWKDVEGYEGLYMVSNKGRVWSNHNQKVLKNVLGKRGYLKVTLSNKKRKEYMIHRLVAQNFLTKVTDKEVVNHIDENKLNNNVDNLEWCTVKENTNHGSCLQRRSEKRNIKIIAINSKTGNCLNFNSLTEAVGFGFSLSNISKCINGVRKTHKGYKWYKQSEFEQKEYEQCI